MATALTTTLRIASASPATADARAGKCLRYEPETVSLVGHLRRETFPGPPNYESVAHGDAAETGFYLHLQRPICTVGEGKDSPDRYEVDGARVVQLVLDSAGYEKLRPRHDLWGGPGSIADQAETDLDRKDRERDGV